MKTKLISILIAVIVLAIGLNCSFANNVKVRFEGNKEITYKITYNGIPSGYIIWRYSGKQKVKGRDADVISLEADTKILKLLNLTTQEKVFLDSLTFLPIKAERDLVFFGKKEIIEEIYDQDKGSVVITKTDSKTSKQILLQDKPIHNILELLYFFPEDVPLVKGKWMNFNLPAQKVRIKMIGEKVLKINGGKENTYLLIGRGAKRFTLWLDKKTRLPLRLDFITWAGKVTIVRKNKHHGS